MNDEYLHPLLFLFSIILFFILHSIKLKINTKLNIFSVIHCIITLLVIFILFINKYIPTLSQLKKLSIIEQNNNFDDLIHIHINRQKNATMIKNMIIYTIIISMGYSIHDIFNGVYEKRYDFLIHGILFAFASLYMYVKSGIYPYLIVIELSTLFLNFLYTRNRYILILFIFTFFICRILYSPYLIYQLCIIYSISIYIKILVCMGSILNFYWFYLIIKKVYKVIIKTKK